MDMTLTHELLHTILPIEDHCVEETRGTSAQLLAFRGMRTQHKKAMREQDRLKEKLREALRGALQALEMRLDDASQMSNQVFKAVGDRLDRKQPIDSTREDRGWLERVMKSGESIRYVLASNGSAVAESCHRSFWSSAETWASAAHVRVRARDFLLGRCYGRST